MSGSQSQPGWEPNVLMSYLMYPVRAEHTHWVGPDQKALPLEGWQGILSWICLTEREDNT